MVNVKDKTNECEQFLDSTLDGLQNANKVFISVSDWADLLTFDGPIVGQK